MFVIENKHVRNITLLKIDYTIHATKPTIKNITHFSQIVQGIDWSTHFYYYF